MFESLENVDWDLLHRQKLILVEWLSGKVPSDPEKDLIWGIVNLLDALQEDVVEVGYWEFPEDRDSKEVGNDCQT